MPRFQSSAFRSRVSAQALSRWGMMLSLVVLFGLSVWLMINFVRITWTGHQINQQMARQAAENEAQRAQNAELKGQAEYRESDVYAEQAAREQLGMARDGETVVVPKIAQAPAEPAPQSSAAPIVANAEAVPPPIEPQTNYQRWWDAFFPSTPATP